MPSVGVDSIDVAALTAAGVPVANTAGAERARSVAEWAVGAALDAVPAASPGPTGGMREGGWPQLEVAARGPERSHTQRVGVARHRRDRRGGGAAVRGARLPGRRTGRGARPEAGGRTGRSTTCSPTPTSSSSPAAHARDAGLLGAGAARPASGGALLVNVARGRHRAGRRHARRAGEGGWPGRRSTYSRGTPAGGPPASAPTRTSCSPRMRRARPASRSSTSSSVVRDNITAAVQGRHVKNVVNGMKPQVHQPLAETLPGRVAPRRREYVHRVRAML